MSGRQENDKQNLIWISHKLIGKPKELYLYMKDIEQDKTTMTQRAYLGYLLQYLDYCNEEDINFLLAKPMHINSYKNHLFEKKNGKSMINTKLAALFSFYKFLLDNEFIDKNPCDTVKKLKMDEKKSVVRMSDDEITEVKQSIINTAKRRSKKYKTRDLAIVTLGCATGLRISEILNIDMDDLDFDNNTIRVIVKGGKQRIIFFGNNTKKVLCDWIDEREEILGNSTQQALFINSHHQRLQSGGVRYMLNKETETFDKHITPHKMRSTCAMKLYEKKGDIYLVAQQLGHSNIKNTMIYAEATEQMRKEAADLLD